MKINWFPGHMKKTLAEMENNLKKVDLAIYILDSRAPISCINPEIDRIVSSKPLLYVLSKSDLSDPKATAKFIQKFKAEGKNIISLNLSSTGAKLELVASINEILKEKKQRLESKSISPILKVMIIGVPNTGKSTLINNLSAVKKATTGDKAGVTKHTQWVKVSDSLALLDTPGTLWPNMKDEMIALKLAFVGSIKDDVLDTTELGFELIKFLMKDHLEILKQRFPSVDFDCEPIEVYDQIAKSRGCIFKGGEVDYDRLGKAVLLDFRSGRMGKITLDRID
ncbi:MAG: ribosome biogenesis GTPase YlqF [Clostridia bacterium]|nr:ribosome biogenesis GTPase YlqF [Clostridia bacterium]